MFHRLGYRLGCPKQAVSLVVSAAMASGLLHVCGCLGNTSDMTVMYCQEERKLSGNLNQLFLPNWFTNHTDL